MIPLFKVAMNSEVDSSLSNIIHSGMITQGKKVEEFEEKLKQLFNYPYILTLNSATAGLTIAHRLLKSDENEQVLTTPLTCFATNASILANNMKIKWVDVDLQTCNIDLNDLKQKISNETKILTIVHWGGNPIDYEQLNCILDEAEQKYGHRISIIEDCAHAFMSLYNGKPVGTFNNISVFSLQAIKHLTTGDGGLIFLPNETLYHRAKLLRWYGIDRDQRNYKQKDLRLENDIVEWGYKFHMNDINATIGLSNLKIVLDNIQKHKTNCKLFNKVFSNLKNVKILKYNGESSSWIYTLFVDNVEKFIEFMKERNIMTSQVHKRNDLNTCLKDFKINLPNLDKLEKHYVCIPCGWWINENEQKSIINAVLEYDQIS
jgi:dTDP-4-amino-4,6-dideoxygalactose transaminase